MRIAIFIAAYEAAKTIEQVIRSIPAGVYESVEQVYVQDDASMDKTYEIALRLCTEYSKLRVCRNPVNLGYGGTKKKAYARLIDDGFDVIVLMHGDGQHPPECLPALITPIAEGRADIVLGSRISGDALGGGMPVYKYAGNRLLTILLNRSLRLRLTDYHTGYRTYSASALRALHYETCGEGHIISTELLVRAVGMGLRIHEVPVRTLYGPASRSMSCWASLKYGAAVIRLLANRGKRLT